MKIINGKETAATLKAEIAAEVGGLVESGRPSPHLVTVIVGHDGGSEAYVANQQKSCAAVGIRATRINLPEETTEEELLAKIAELNADADVDGFIVQLPLPRHIDSQRVTEAIDWHKDVDGFHPVNIGRMQIGLDSFRPATPSAIMELLRRYDVQTKGRHAVVIGRSNIVGKPIATMLMQKSQPGDCTVTVCHSSTPDIKEQCRRADIIIAALGKPGFVTADMVKPGAVVIDVGTTRVPDPSRKSGSRICGDVDFETVAPLCEQITPVPGGVGPVTNCILLLNTLKAYHLNRK